jgi:hypothetical protein
VSMRSGCRSRMARSSSPSRKSSHVPRNLSRIRRCRTAALGLSLSLPCQCAFGKGATEDRCEIEALRANTLGRVRDAAVVHAMTAGHTAYWRGRKSDSDPMPSETA